MNHSPVPKTAQQCNLDFILTLTLTMFSSTGTYEEDTAKVVPLL